MTKVSMGLDRNRKSKKGEAERSLKTMAVVLTNI